MPHIERMRFSTFSSSSAAMEISKKNIIGEVVFLEQLIDMLDYYLKDRFQKHQTENGMDYYIV